MQSSIVFSPLFSWPILVALMIAVAVVLGFVLWRGLAGFWLRAVAALIIILALANPSFQTEQREAIADVVLMVVDRTASQNISDRPQQVDQALDVMSARLQSRPNTELKVVDIGDAPDQGGTLLMGELAEALAQVPQNQIAGIVVISDGQIHDMNHAPEIPAPLHYLQTGHADDWDRRLIVTNAPGFGILGESLELTIRIEDQGNVPANQSNLAELVVSVDGGTLSTVSVPVNKDISLPLSLEHGGINVVQLETATEPGELTDRNNSAVIQINGVRDRLSVLLISGEPYPGERTWRNLLKSDSSVDLVHFTILRPPQKQDQAPVSELALIAFPTRELFLEKINDFDLIIFDRYRRRGILPSVYLENVRQYVEDGGAVLLAAGPGFASAESLYRSPLGDIIPAIPTSRLIETGFKPIVSEVGERHPVTAGLAQPNTEPGAEPSWGRWFRLVELQENGGDTLMTGPENLPLLVLDRVGEGRIALLASDHAWLWGRGFESGGPQQELLRRLAHWMMKEPDLEEESLGAVTDGQTMTITRRTLSDDPRDVEIVGPDGSSTIIEMENAGSGRFVTQFDAPEIGLYRLKDGEQSAIVVLGPSAPKEFEETIATDEKIGGAVKATRGGVVEIEQGLPDVRAVQSGRVAAGRGWIGITPRNAYLTTDVRLTPLLPAWMALLLVSFFSVGAWLWEGRR